MSESTLIEEAPETAGSYGSIAPGSEVVAQDDTGEGIETADPLKEEWEIGQVYEKIG